MAPEAMRLPKPSRWFALPAWVDRLIHLGIVSEDPDVVRRQRLTNVGVYAAMADQISHLVSNSLHDFQGLLIIHAYNALMVVLELFIHRLHRRGPNAGAVAITVLIILGNTFVVTMFGSDAGLQIYHTLAGAAILVIGVQNWRLWLPLAGLALFCLILTLTFVPPRGFIAPGDAAIRLVLSQQAMVAALLINCGLILYALLALHRAQSQLQVALGRSDNLLLTLLPGPIADRLKAAPAQPIADRLDDVTILFADLVGFTSAAHALPPEEVVAYLDDLVRSFDRLCADHGVEKIKTIGDSYMAASGVGAQGADGAVRMGRFALAMRAAQDGHPTLGTHKLALRIGLHCGEATAGVIGDTRMGYDLWGDAVNTASRLESTGKPGCIHVSEAFRTAAADAFRFEPRGMIEMKGIGSVETFFLSPRDETQPGGASIAAARSMQ
ncbi:adenylate/guanylate cyclase domain-containing protein [Phreatobacter aquaticus]|uniref:Adenylate/guanylate cyclase domain-containing protein n=1 Tax=Phreatobacter aquaticus TaxID=2570229 RepID=A0A4D7QBZ1_9HYPH|nr:adenylate/guanylate cyclase domain-containing protein [Phreatobacter aquaticus]QCK85530.1 adenylate/guanylate cyclase domain-containing protein [Phreatobacter aquaticus]